MRRPAASGSASPCRPGEMEAGEGVGGKGVRGVGRVGVRGVERWGAGRGQGWVSRQGEAVARELYGRALPYYYFVPTPPSAHRVARQPWLTSPVSVSMLPRPRRAPSRHVMAAPILAALPTMSDPGVAPTRLGRMKLPATSSVAMPLGGRGTGAGREDWFKADRYRVWCCVRATHYHT